MKTHAVAAALLAAAALACARPNQPPVPAFVVDPPSGPAPLTVVLDASGAVDPDGSIVAYAWEFGDGERGSGRTAEHRYAATGVYTARLAVTDDRGVVRTANRGVVVEEPLPVPAAEGGEPEAPAPSEGEPKSR
ncbi:MAG: PKD domain-containing protein [Deferrisomatales bacterium]